MFFVLLVAGVFELYVSLTFNEQSAFLYALYTALQGHGAKAIGITHMLCPVDKDAHAKARREYRFPVALLNKGIQFECTQGEVDQVLCPL